MKNRLKLSILVFLTVLLSCLNIKNGLNLSITDTEANTFTASYSKKDSLKSVEKPSLKTANIPIRTAVLRATASSSHVTIFGQKYNLVNGSVKNNQVTTPATGVAKYQKMLYGHSTVTNIKNLKKGSHFTVTTGGKTTTYEIIDNPKSLSVADANKNASLIYSATYEKYLVGSYDLTLMTCTGTISKNGEASHRLVYKARIVK